jgi:D-tyrosyl-tRNA(Tyr) deacylase
MRVLIQRVSGASVTIEGQVISSIGAGLLVFVGIEEADGGEDIEWLVGKIARLRVFDDEGGVMNLDVVQSSGEVLVVSQFTLHASTRKGNRPSYIRSARPEISEPLYERFCERLGEVIGKKVGQGVFGADMQVSLTNDGPVTIWIDSKNRE